MARYPGATWKPIGAGGTVRMSRYDQLVLHTCVGSLVGTDNYFRTQPNNSHFGVGGKWGADAAAGLDGKVYQWVDTAFRSAATRQGNPRVIAVECADNAPRYPSDIAAFTDAQQDALAAIMVWAYRTHGIPLVAARNSLSTTRGIGYHKLGCDPYRVAGGELWSSAYGKVCPADRRIAQIPGLIARAVAIANGQPQEDDMPTPDELWNARQPIPADLVKQYPPDSTGYTPIRLEYGNNVLLNQLIERVDALVASVDKLAAAVAAKPPA